MTSLPANAKNILPLQHLDGTLHTFASSFSDDTTNEEILNKMLERVRPAPMTIFRKILGIKQNSHESV